MEIHEIAIEEFTKEIENMSPLKVRLSPDVPGQRAIAQSKKTKKRVWTSKLEDV